MKLPNRIPVPNTTSNAILTGPPLTSRIVISFHNDLRGAIKSELMALHIKRGRLTL